MASWPKHDSKSTALAVRVASDGRVFSSERRGILKLFRSLDASPIVVADVTTTSWINGTAGFGARARYGFPAKPYVKDLYTYDAPPGKIAPVWNDGS
jgi:hypothetical protein